MHSVFQRAFTLIEVNLAMLVMAGGVLSMVSLYALGFRENRQSREDIAGAVVAESVLNALETALSSRKLTWNQWKNFGDTLNVNNDTVRVWPQNGWKSYISSSGNGRYKVEKNLNGKASDVFGKLTSSYQSAAQNGTTATIPSWSQIVPESDVSVALVASRESDMSPVITLAVRVVRGGQERTLFSQPIYFTEVHFQGDPNS